MVDKTPSATTRRGAPPGADPPMGSPEAGAVPATMVLGYVDLAITGTLEYDRYRDVYLSPWWPLSDVPDGMYVWKRAVLRRQPGRGAAHWGHLYLIVRAPEVERFRIFGRSLFGRPGPSPPAASIVLREGEQTAELSVRASHPESIGELEEFAREIRERFRRQMD